ncbi:hypothetical protein [Sporomusa sp. KB1]|jgi:hypothetical protein|uniref:hypothetical protein n=1 Tax=Sporomusa sp. KB1 TaxID=943346 RepID=UPI0011A1EEEF|nr:hypothetical protein [Sporomusa sp. KB1]TWH45066.1 hypothetical protein Salpa_0956 [Sporomusa sp. KB1]
MNQEIFADAISAIHVTGQLVRIDLLTVQPHLKSDNGQPVVEVNKRIVMTLEGFVQSLAVQDNIIKQLISAGVLKQNTPGTDGGINLAEKITNKETEAN